jgi:multidrug transporter EmrE-like cation transporter
MIQNLFLILVAIVCNVFAQVSIKKAGQANLFSQGFHSITFEKIVTNHYVWAGMILYTISFLLTIKIYGKYDLSLISPIMAALIFIGIIIVSNLMFGEHISLMKIVGVILLIIGIVFISNS